MDSVRHSSGSVIIEDLNTISNLRCPILHSSRSADLAPVHCPTKTKIRMNESSLKFEKESESTALTLSSTLKETLVLGANSSNIVSEGRNGICLRLGTTDAEIHHSSQNAAADCTNLLKNQATTSSHKNTPPDTLQSSSKKQVKNDLPANTSSTKGLALNGYVVPETFSSNSITISDFSMSSEKSISSQSSQATNISTGARPRIKSDSNSSTAALSTNPQNECELDLSSSISKSPNLINSVSGTISPVSLENHVDDIDVKYVNYENEYQMEAIMKLIQKDLSEPYSIYTYRYFIHNWPKLCFLAIVNEEIIGAIVCKLDLHKKVSIRGYIAMLAVDQKFRKRKIGSNLVQKAIKEMAADDADEVVLETEITNTSALQLYENLGFVRDKRLFRYYLNGVDALRLKLWLS